MEILLNYWGVALDYWSGLPYDVRWYAWAGTGLSLMVLFLVWSHGFMRRLLGYRKHRGTWYDEEQYAELMQIFQETANVRVLQHEDMVALRQWKHGDVKEVGFKWKGGYF